MRRSIRNTKGFTLIELMIVVVIIGILAALAIPRFTKSADKAKEKEADGIIKQVYTLQGTYKAQYGEYAADVAGLELVGFEQPQHLENYTFNSAVDGNPYCLTPTATGPQTKCINLDTGEITAQ